jgi:hypothetical protein
MAFYMFDGMDGMELGLLCFGAGLWVACIGGVREWGKGGGGGG